MKIDIWSDVACPFCYIGITQLETVLRETNTKAEVIFHSFELDPNSPKETTKTLSEVLALKYGMTPVKAWEANVQATEMAAQEGLEFKMNKAVPVNTFDAHRLIHLAAAEGKQRETKMRLLAAYFSEGKSVADHATLTELALEVGLDADKVAAMLSGDDYTEAVRNDIATAASYGARGVPFFLVNEKYTFSGAQGVEGFKKIFDEVSGER